MKLVFAISAVIVGFGLLMLAMVVLALSWLRALVTGRKPAHAWIFGRFQGFPATGSWPGTPAVRPAAGSAQGEIVDVEMREVPDARNERRLP
ncbi:MAG: hypothetical protein JWP47_1228 [Polaromonas sp.]|nr:hypothetical protein [Polaromonas sp.]